MAKKKSQSPPRRKRMKRSSRLQAASQCLEQFTGGRAVRGYARWFGVDFECAVTELRLLGVVLDAAYLQAARASLDGERRAKAAATERAQIHVAFPGDQRFAFIVGRTEAGFAFGTTWGTESDEK